MNHINDMKRRKRSYEAHTFDPTTHTFPSNVVASQGPYQWHEMDYTSPTMETARFAPTSAPVQYNTGGMMSFSPVDYTRHESSFASPYPENDGSVPVHQSGMYRVGPFRYNELANMDGDTASLSQESIYSRSTRLHSLTDSERRDSQPNSIFSGSEMRRESEGLDRIFPMASLESEHCSVDACGPEPPCMDLNNLVSIEECAPVPCMTPSSHFLLPRSSSNPNDSRNQSSPIQASQSGFTSPTTLTFQGSHASEENSKTLKAKRMPRSKSAHASIGDASVLEKASKLRARQAHSLVERKYRDNLNMKISQLHQTLQTAKFGPSSTLRSPQNESKTDYFDDEPLVSPDIPNEKSSTGSTPTGAKVRKSDVLTEAMTYVNSAETEMRHMSEEIIRLNARVKALEKLVRCEDCSLLKQMVTLQVEAQQMGQVG